MNIPAAAILAPAQRTPQDTSRTGASPAATGAFMNVLADVRGQGAAATAQSVDAPSPPWVPWTEEELSNLELEGVPKWEVQNLREQTFPEIAAERWMRIIAPFLNEASLPDAKTDYIAAGRAKCPFLDWVLSGKDPVEFFRQPGKLAVPLHQVTDGISPIMITSGSQLPQTAVPAPMVVSSDVGARAVPHFTEPPLMAPVSAEPGPDRSQSTYGERGDDQAQGAAHDVATERRPASNTDTSIAASAVRLTDAHIGPADVRSANGPHALPATAAVLVAREAVEAARPQQGQASRPVLATATVVAHTELPHPDAVVRPPLPAAPTRAAGMFLAELAERIQVQLRDGGNDIRIQLRPATLGHLEITAQTGNEGVVARIVTESSAVKQYLESNLHVLEKALSDQGLRMDRIDVVAQGYFETGQSNSQPQGHYSGSGRRQDSGQPEGAITAVGGASTDGGLAELSLVQAIGPNSTFHTVA